MEENKFKSDENGTRRLEFIETGTPSSYGEGTSTESHYSRSQFDTSASSSTSEYVDNYMKYKDSE